MTEERAEKSTPEYVCEFCSQSIRGNGYFQHVRSCERKPRGATKKIYPVELPAGVYQRFHAKCKENGQTLAIRVWQLIEQDIG